jgi:ankyrin repeat protein
VKAENWIALELEREMTLLEAATGGEDHTVKLLLDTGVNPNCRDKSENTPLILASARGYLPVVEALLSGGACVDAENVDGETALMLASREGYSQTVHCLLKAGAIADRPNQYDGGTALIEATLRGSINAIQHLLNFGASLARKDGRGFTALDWARKFHKQAVIDYLGTPPLILT